ncbi:MAG: flavin reductase family protein [Pseudolabrys sp.]|nr:flavin reductase family protein [Pseudolabrys sp.]MBV9956289.1 flavin reductase family protein [Pseudolabrys sp.]
MFYDTRDKSRPLQHDPFKAIVTPRPIGWVTTISAAGKVNLAPYSYFNGVLSRPNLVMFSSEGYKDSLRNAEETGEFVCNLATWDLREAMNATSAPLAYGINEMEKAGLEPAPSKLVKPPRVAKSPCALECKLVEVVKLKDAQGDVLDGYIAIGQVIGVHIDDHFIKDGRLDSAAMKPIARCGYDEYAVYDSVFRMTRPTS